MADDPDVLPFSAVIQSRKAIAEGLYSCVKLTWSLLLKPIS